MAPCVCVPGAPCAGHARAELEEAVKAGALARLEDAALAWGEHQDGLAGRVGGAASVSTLMMRSRLLQAAWAFSVASRRAAVARLRASALEGAPGNDGGSSVRTGDVMATGV